MFLAQNADYLDWWLLQKFPGRTLEELDSVDWLRLQRAQEVDRIVTVEQKRQLMTQGKLKGDDITADEWRTIRRHDRLLDDDTEVGNG